MDLPGIRGSEQGLCGGIPAPPSGCAWSDGKPGQKAPHLGPAAVGGLAGGQLRDPAPERLAAGGLRFTRFHTTALGSPRRRRC
jgi:hypothetical protein